MKTAVIGLGLIGGSLAKDLKGLNLTKEVIGVENNKAHAAKAVELGLVSRVEPLEKALAEAEFVILAIPVNAIVSLLPKVLELCRAEAAVTDMGSTKEAICKAVKGHAKRKNFVASHPMAGTENSGPEAAIAGLFTHKTAVICDKDESSPKALQRVKEMYQALRMRLVYMDSSAHDVHAAYVSHLSHISSFVLANTVLDKERNTSTIFDLAGGGFESTVRLAKSSPDMWAPIFEQNKKYVLDALTAYIDHLQKFKDSIASGDFTLTHQLMDRANEIRRVLANISSSVQPKK